LPPSHPPTSPPTPAQERRLDLAHSAALALDRAALVKYDRRSGALQATDLGRIASHYYASHRTIAAFNEHLRPTMGDIELLRLFTSAEEFKFMVVREVRGDAGVAIEGDEKRACFAPLTNAALSPLGTALCCALCEWWYLGLPVDSTC
jgi:hypothetical protein